jgi:very-short-patch-repair endonuclease
MVLKRNNHRQHRCTKLPKGVTPVPPLVTLREAIADALSVEKAYNLAEVCVNFGLRPAAEGEDPYRSKRIYVLNRIKNMELDALFELAEKVIEEYGQEDYLRPIMRLYSALGVEGEAKNLIFAANGPKPDIVLADAINNRIEIVANGEYCLVFDKPILKTGLMWADLVAWWQQRNPALASQPVEVERNLYRRLYSSLDSAPERLLFEAYFTAFRSRCGGNPPALVPQVYLHYDPHTIKQLGGRGRLKRQRMDFLLLFDNRQRVVLEVDGKQHYSKDGAADPGLYATMVSEDRQLRLAGYEIYRFGGAELQGDEGKRLVTSFFEALFERHGIVCTFG